MKPASGSPTAGVLPFLGSTTRREAPWWAHKAKRGQRSQPVKPLWRIRDKGKHPEPGTDRHILALCAIFDQGSHAGPRAHFGRQQARFWTRRGSKRTSHLGLLRCLKRLQGLRHKRFEWTQSLFIASGSLLQEFQSEPGELVLQGRDL